MSCSSCNAPIIWVRTRTRRKMPLDSTPTARGTVRIEHGYGEVLTGMFLEAARDDGEELYVSHFATCPDAHRHRTKADSDASV